MSHLPHPSHTVRPATKTDVVGARQVMLDTFYRDFGYGYVPEWHRDVIDIEGTYLGDPRHLLLVAVHDSEVVHDRHHGLARTLVVKACDFAADAPGYDSIYLHTNVNIEGAEAFWRSMAKEVFDARTTGEHGPGVGTIHFEIPMPQAAAPMKARSRGCHRLSTLSYAAATPEVTGLFPASPSYRRGLTGHQGRPPPLSSGCCRCALVPGVHFRRSPSPGT